MIAHIQARQNLLIRVHSRFNPYYLVPAQRLPQKTTLNLTRLEKRLNMGQPVHWPTWFEMLDPFMWRLIKNAEDLRR